MLVVYRTDFAGRDEKLVDSYIIEGAKYICFTDRDEDEVPEPWEVRRPQKLFECPRLTGIWHKTHPHEILPPHDYSVYMNANVGLLSDPTPILKSGFGLHRHRWRTCLFEEAKFCRDIGLISWQDCRRQLEAYRNHVRSRPTGLWETGSVVRDNTEQTQVINENWWKEIVRHTTRDQISLAFINSVLDFIYDIPGNFSESEYFYFEPHGGPFPLDEEAARMKFPGYMRRRAQWEENVKQSSQEPDDVEPPA